MRRRKGVEGRGLFQTLQLLKSQTENPNRTRFNNRPHHRSCPTAETAPWKNTHRTHTDRTVVTHTQRTHSVGSEEMIVMRLQRQTRFLLLKLYVHLQQPQ